MVDWITTRYISRRYTPLLQRQCPQRSERSQVQPQRRGRALWTILAGATPHGIQWPRVEPAVVIRPVHNVHSRGGETLVGPDSGRR
jgi:hypothetical protein